MSTKEKIYLVDAKDKIIGSIYRSDLTDSDCWRIISVWITNDAGEILLQQRSLKKKIYPGIWTAAVEGTVEAGDDYNETAKREVQEEIGLADAELTQANKYHGRWGSFGSRQAQGYKVVFNGTIDELTAQESEVGDIKWFSRAELEDLHTKTPELFPLYEQYKQLDFI